jgi:potassium efflux system protein
MIVTNLIGIKFDKEPEEQQQPGYFSEGIYTNVPLLFDVASEGVQNVKHWYKEEYDEEPNWVTITAYEAAKIAIEAIENTGVQGKPENRAEERQKIRDFLKNRLENAFEGISGTFYFDKHGNAIRPLAIGVFKNQRVISALTQLQPVSDLKPVESLETEETVIIEGQPNSFVNCPPYCL